MKSDSVIFEFRYGIREINFNFFPSLILIDNSSFLLTISELDC